MTTKLNYYLARLGLVFKRGCYLFYYMDCSKNDAVDSATELVEVRAGEITNEIIFGWLTLDEAKLLISIPFNRMFLLKKGNEPVASCWVQTKRMELRFIEGCGVLPQGSAYVSHVIVKPHFRGEGAASKLLGRLTQYLKHDGIEKMFLCIDHRNAPMQKVIHKLGFLPYFGIRYFRALFIRSYFVQVEDIPRPKWRRVITSLPPDLHLIDIHFKKSQS